MTSKKLVELSLLIGVLGTYAVLYYLNNNYQYFDVWHVPRTTFDDLISFSPYWIWVYLTAYLLPFFMFFYLSRLKLHLHFLELFFILTILTNIIFFLFPTTIDRVSVPVDGVDPLTKLAFEILFSTDKPFTCFTSTHVSTSFVAAMSVRQFPKVFMIFIGFSALISYSAMAIGQHYLYDALGGAMVALMSLGFKERLKKVWAIYKR
jgi:membrane-associated phospholipid phosphatase